jgi:DNA (cytosine-5)-methyltransferase 1
MATADSPSRFNLIDLFAGVGGLTSGFRDSTVQGSCIFTPRLLVDIDPEARPVAMQNFPETPYLVRDVHSLSGAEIRLRAGLERRETLHALVGGPPCQGFSWLGKRALDDERNACLLDFLRLVKELRPLVALIENVPLIISAHGGAIISEIVDGLSSLGYASCADVLTASDFGVPQLRRRAFVLAYRADLCTPPQFPARTHERIPGASAASNSGLKLRFEDTKLPYISVEEAISDLPPLNAGEGEEVLFYSKQSANQYQAWARAGSVAIFNHRSRAHSKKYLEKISVIEEGGRNQDLPDDQRFSDNYYSQAYARLSRHGIAQTVTTCFGNPGSGRFLHYRDLRAITVREAARFQSFPDTFVFGGHHSTQMRHVGNAVPLLLARAIRDQIAQDLLSAGVGNEIVGGRRTKTIETTEQRSRIMRAVPGKNTSVEKELRRLLCDADFRGYRLHDSRVPGSPDVVFTRIRVAIFVDGCFWHGCAQCYRAPKSNSEYWTMKVRRNKERDERVTVACEAAGWVVLRLWEHEILKTPAAAISKVTRIMKKAERASTKAHKTHAGKQRPTTARRSK